MRIVERLFFNQNKPMIEREKYTIEQIQHGIIRIEIKEGIHFTEEDLRDVNQIYIDDLQVKHGLFLIVIGEGSTNDFDNYKRFARPDRNIIRKAEAVVVKSVMHNIETDYYIKHFKVGHPIKIFDNEEDAILWLKLI